MLNFKKRRSNAGVLGGLRGFGGFFVVRVVAVFVVDVSFFAVRVVAVFVVDVSFFAVRVVAVGAVDVSFFAVRVIAVGAVDVFRFAVIVSATGAVDVSGFAVRGPGGDFAAENEERERAADKQKSEGADRDEGGRGFVGFRFVDVVLAFGHFCCPIF